MLLKCLVTILLSVGIFMSGFSQYSIKGIVVLSQYKSLILNVNFVLRKPNGVLQLRQVTSGDRFELGGLTAGKFSLLISCMGYVDYSREFELSLKNPGLDLGKIILLEKSNLLKEVRISAGFNPIRINGDTLSYHAPAFQSNPNDKVENLLKQLPGISVDKDGKLSVQGQKIDKVLVDGAEFFGDDPTLATRNIRADMVEKIQVFDKKSDLAMLTGVKDGKGDRTINIKLKADKKHGYFGRADLGKGTDGYYSGQMMLNFFNNQQRVSVYGVAGNNGTTSLGWQDNAKYASASVDNSVPGYNIDLGGYDELESRNGSYNGQGIPVAKTSGLHYENKWSKNKNSVNFNYKIGSLTTAGERNVSTQNSLPSGLLNNLSNQEFSNKVFRQKLDGVFDFKLDSNTTLKVTMNGGIKNTSNRNNDRSTALVVERADSGQAGYENRNDDLVNSIENFSCTMESVDSHWLMFSVLYLKKLKRKGRTFTAGIVNSLEEHQMDGQLLLVEHIDQHKTRNISNKGRYTNFTYSEPLSKSLLLLVNYGLGLTNNRISRYSFNRFKEGSPGILDSLYSNNFELKQLGHEGGLSFNLAKNKMILNFGSKWSAVALKQTDHFFQKHKDRGFLLWNNQLNFQYTLSNQSNIRFNYEGLSTPPPIAKLQPVLVNDDPLNVTQGNPFLKPSFSNSFFVGYQSYHPVNGQLIGVFVNYKIIFRPIVNKMQTAADGKMFTQFTNLFHQQSRSVNLSLFYDRKVNPLDLTAGVNFNVNGNTAFNLSNDSLNRLHDYTYKLQMRCAKVLANVYEFNLSFGPTYTVSGSSLQPDYPNNGRGFLTDADIRCYLPFKIQIGASGAYQYLEKTAAFNQRFSRIMINASISKLLLKGNELKLSLSVSDLLNQNVGFNRSISGSLITQQSFTVIKRYFMLTATYDLHKMMANPSK